VVHRADARVKLVTTLAVIASATSLPPGGWAWYGILLAIAWVAVLAARVGPIRILRRTAIAVPFMLVAVPTVFTSPGAEIGSVDIGSWHIAATRPGLQFFVSVLLRSWISVTAAVLLVTTTPFVQVIDALQWLRLPATLVMILAFMYRYLFVLVDEASRLMRARAVRSASVGLRTGGTLIWRARVAGGMVGSLFIRTYERSERIYQAMLARGYDGRVRRPESRTASPATLLQMLVSLALSGTVAGLARVTGLFG
jgi:cobalt/nickel transport system permease protein